MRPWTINRTGLNRGSGWKRKTIEMLNKNTLEITVTDEKGKKKKLYSKVIGKKGEAMTLTDAVIAMQTVKALKGDPKAFELLRDTAGESPTQKIEVGGNVNDNLMKIDLSKLTDEELHTWEKLFRKVTIVKENRDQTEEESK